MTKIEKYEGKKRNATGVEQGKLLKASISQSPGQNNEK